MDNPPSPPFSHSHNALEQIMLQMVSSLEPQMILTSITQGLFKGVDTGKPQGDRLHRSPQDVYCTEPLEMELSVW